MIPWTTLGDCQRFVTISGHPDRLAVAPGPGTGYYPAERKTVEMTVTELEGPVALVQLVGRLDAAGADAVGVRFTAAIAARTRDAVVDLSGVTFIASLGIRLLISTARALALKGHRMALFGAPALVQEVFDDSALDQVMPIVATEAEALAAVVA
jgi:anti-sigma B factor antagonist